MADIHSVTQEGRYQTHGGTSFRSSLIFKIVPPINSSGNLY